MESPSEEKTVPPGGNPLNTSLDNGKSAQIAVLPSIFSSSHPDPGDEESAHLSPPAGARHSHFLNETLDGSLYREGSTILYDPETGNPHTRRRPPLHKYLDDSNVEGEVSPNTSTDSLWQPKTPLPPMALSELNWSSSTAGDSPPRQTDRPRRPTHTPGVLEKPNSQLPRSQEPTTISYFDSVLLGIIILFPFFHITIS
jgi:hypothetical protein